MKILSPKFLDFLMEEALKEAQLAAQKCEVPIGAVIAHREKIIARSHNLIESRNDATAHAEILAIQEASRTLKNWRLANCVLVVTLEPCTMCMGAIQLARIPVLAFGACDERLGAAGSAFDLTPNDESLRIISGINKSECEQILRDFFAKKRGGSNGA